MFTSSRRQFVRTFMAGLVGAGIFRRDRRALAAGPATADASACTLSIGTYSMKSLPLEQAIEAIARIGFDGIELATQPGFAAEPQKLSNEERRKIRELLARKNLRLTALMEQLAPAARDDQHKSDLDRLRRVAELARDLAPERPPLIQTVLGSGDFEQKKQLLRDRLGDWLAVTSAAGVVLAIKPHRGGVVSTPAEAIWLIQQLQGAGAGAKDASGPAAAPVKQLRMVYDYSHYAFRDLPLEDTVRQALPFTAHIAVKDAVQKDGKVVFTLPGESGTIDYARLLQLFHAGGYRGDVCCEVSAMIWQKKEYDPIAAATTCHTNMSAAFEKAGLRRATRR